MRDRFFRILFFLILGTGLAAWGASHVPWPRAPLAAAALPPLSTVQSWGYQLQGVTPGAIDQRIDLVVVDYSRDGSERRAWSPIAVEALRLRQGLPKRVVLAYMSIGEAERYRYYWWRSWRFIKPRWLGSENDEWKGNYRVDYWDSDWQRIFLDPRPDLMTSIVEQQLEWLKPYVDRVLEAGFDGVYLDRVDAFMDAAARRPTAEEDMVAFVGRLSAYAKARKPGFLIVPQNGEELLAHEPYLAAIDGVAKEDLYFGAEKDGAANDKDEIEGSVTHLLRARARGLPVFVVEYIEGAERRRGVQRAVAEMGFIPLFASRDLNLPPQPVPALADDARPAAAAPAPAGAAKSPE